jgi:hypothetical protein
MMFVVVGLVMSLWTGRAGADIVAGPSPRPYATAPSEVEVFDYIYYEYYLNDRDVDIGTTPWSYVSDGIDSFILYKDSSIVLDYLSLNGYWLQAGMHGTQEGTYLIRVSAWDGNGGADDPNPPFSADVWVTIHS